MPSNLFGSPQPAPSTAPKKMGTAYGSLQPATPAQPPPMQGSEGRATDMAYRGGTQYQPQVQPPQNRWQERLAPGGGYGPSERRPGAPPQYDMGRGFPGGPPIQAQPMPQQGGGFKNYMSDMRNSYRGSMQTAGLNPSQIRQKMQAMRADQRTNRAGIANQYMREQMPQQGNPMSSRWQPPQPGQGAGINGGMSPDQMRMAQMGNAIQSNPNLSAGEMRGQMEQFNQRGRPVASRSNLLPAQQNTWQQRMAGGMRGNPQAAPMPQRPRGIPGYGMPVRGY